MGCTEAEWLGWLPAAIGAHAWQRDGQSVRIALDKPESESESGSTSASVCIRWSVGEPRVIALVRIPRLRVQFDFSAADAAQRFRFSEGKQLCDRTHASSQNSATNPETA